MVHKRAVARQCKQPVPTGYTPVEVASSPNPFQRGKREEGRGHLDPLPLAGCPSLEEMDWPQALLVLPLAQIGGDPGEPVFGFPFRKRPEVDTGLFNELL